MKRIQEMSVEEIVERFRSISRQRISQILKRVSDRGDVATMQKINKAKAILKEQRKVLNNEKTGQILLDNPVSVSQNTLTDKQQEYPHQ
jgi:flagellar basal body P-ring protein FlgI